MQDTLFSSQWYRVAELRPRLRSNVVTHRHYYRGKLWYVVGAKANRSHVRINASAHFLLVQFDGRRSVDSVWRSALTELGDDAPSQQDMLGLLSLLFQAGVIDCQRETDVDQLFDGHRRKQAQAARTRYWNPFYLRFALFNPNRLAQSLLPWFDWAFSRLAFRLWILLVLGSAVAAAVTWRELLGALNADLASRSSLLMLWILFPAMKLVHELAHALTIKRWGGEVNELGIALLVLLPIPYVDASDSARFSGKYRRMAVAGAGIVVETTLACLGLIVCLLVEPGLVRDAAFNVFLIGSVSSVLLNGNPLLKFDAYYVLSDFIEIPNLASRSNRYLLYIVKHHLFGMDDTSPVTAAGERPWFVAYGLLAFVYRLSLTFGICLFVASKYFFIGVAVALWALLLQIGLPVLRGLKFLFLDPRRRGLRLRVNAVVAGAGGLFVAAAFFVPFSDTTYARGIVWPIDEAVVRAGADCLVDAVLVENGALVEAGTELLRCDPTLLAAEVAQLRAEQMAASAAVYAARDQAARSLKQSELETISGLLANAEQKLEKITIVSSTRGEYYAPNAINLTGSYFPQGTVIGYVLDESNLSIRTVLAQERSALLGEHLGDVEVRMLSRPGAAWPSTVLRQAPAATDTLVSPALGAKGGGSLDLDPEDREGVRLLQAAFEVELELPGALHDSLVGEAVHVRFDHGTTSGARLLYRELRLLFLRRFNV